MKHLVAAAVLLLSSLALSGQIIYFDLAGQAGAGLLPGNELHGPSGSASGGEINAGIFLDQSTNILTINVGWGTSNGFSNLTGVATNAHIHGAANQTTAAGVVLGLTSSPFTFNTSASAGFITGSVDLDTASLGNGSTVTDLMNGSWYINVHTGANGSGEIRGNLIQAVPEPSVYAAVFGLAAIGFAFLKHGRRVA